MQQALGSTSTMGRSLGGPLRPSSSRRSMHIGGRHRASRLQCSAAAGAVQVGEALLAAGLDHCASVDPHCPRDTPNTTIATAPGLQNPFLYPREMDGLQTALSGLPTAGVYVVGAALTAGMGAVGFTAAQALAPGASVAVVVAVVVASLLKAKLKLMENP